MKKILIFILLVSLILGSSITTYANTEGNLNTDFTITDEQINAFDAEVSKYLENHKVTELTPKETKKILKKLGLNDVKVISEKEMNTIKENDAKRASSVQSLLDIDRVDAYYVVESDTATLFKVKFTAYNLDYIDTHDHYFATITGWREVAPGAHSWLAYYSGTLDEYNIAPRHYVYKRISIVPNSCGAYFSAMFWAYDDGETYGPVPRVKTNAYFNGY